MLTADDDEEVTQAEGEEIEDPDRGLCSPNEFL
jgi:hypothetical protein